VQVAILCRRRDIQNDAEEGDEDEADAEDGAFDANKSFFDFE
jgi:hypothetical protein